MAIYNSFQSDTTSGNTAQEEFDVVANVRDPRFAGGAKGDWNQTDQTGTDDTAAFQAAIDYLVSLPDMRNGGARAIYLGSGSYYVKGLVVPQSFGFGFAMYGDDWNSCNVYFDVDTPATKPGLDLQCEFARFKNIRFIGAKADNITNDTRCNIIRSKLGDMRADCDVSVQGCFFVSAISCIQLYGRGLLVDGCAFNGSVNAIEIVADPAQNWPAGQDQANGPESGMRNYRISNVRIDNCNYILAVSGDGEQKDYINGFLMKGIDIYSNIALISIPDATLRGLVVADIVGQEACPLGLVRGKAINGAVFSNLAISKTITRDVDVSGGNPTMQGLFTMTGAMDNIVVDGCDFGPVRNYIVQIGAASSNITMTNLNFHRLFSVVTELAINTLILQGANVNGFHAQNWNITGAGPGTGKNIWSCNPVTQTSNRISFQNINSSFPVAHIPITRTPGVVFGETEVTPVFASMTVEYQGLYAEVYGAINVSASGAAANTALGVSTGLALLPMFSGQTSGVAGGGDAYYHTMSSNPSSLPVPAHARVTEGGVIQFYKASTGNILTSTDMGTDIHAIQFRVRVKIDPKKFA